MDEAMRLYRSQTWRTRAVLILESNALAIAAGTGDYRQQVRVHAWAATFQGNNESVQGHDTVPQSWWKHLLEFEKSAHRGLFHAADAALSRSSQPERDGYGFIVIQQEWRKSRTRSELVAPFYS
jgi:hypothetical protein